MPGKPPTTWKTPWSATTFADLSQTLRQQPRKAAMLSVLVVVMIALWARALIHGDPSAASASSMLLSGTDNSHGLTLPDAFAHQRSDHSLQDWLSSAKRPAGRNVFQVHPEFFPSDGVRSANANEFDDSNDPAKSQAALADQLKQRQLAMQLAQTRAGQLRLQSTLMGGMPRAVIDGEMVREGDVVSSFRVLRIEPRRVTVERDGVQFPIEMK